MNVKKVEPLGSDPIYLLYDGSVPRGQVFAISYYDIQAMLFEMGADTARQCFRGAFPEEVSP